MTIKIVNIRGGLGNQMFQYAFALSLKKHWGNCDIYLDTSHYNYIFNKTNGGNDFFHNGFELYNVFPNIDIKIARRKDIIKYSYFIPNYYLSRVCRKFLPIRKTEFIQPSAFKYVDDPYRYNSYKYFEGYWISVNYIKNCLQEVNYSFNFTEISDDLNKQIASLISQRNSVSIHVRRGDLLKIKNANICTMEYYKYAIRYIKSNVTNPLFFIFSDDIDYCKDNFSSILVETNVIYVQNNLNKSAIDMHLMSLCKHNIISNSTFSWWAAFLNKNREKIVIAPKFWENSSSEFDLYLDEWKRI